MLETRFEIVRGGHPLRVARAGSGPPLVLLHGYPDNLQIWSRLAPRLTAAFEVFAFDWPGMGRSEPWPGGATPLHQADRLLELLAHWRIERAHLVGMDMGAQPALVLAAQHPERVASLVVMGSLVMWDAETSWELKLLRRFGWNRRLITHLPRAVFSRAVATSLPDGAPLPDDVRADLWDSFRRASVRQFVVRMCAGYQASLPRLPALYPRIACPTLILWGERDRHFPPVHARRLHELVRGSTLEIIPGAEHWMPWHRAADVAERITRASSRSPPPGRPSCCAAPRARARR